MGAAGYADDLVRLAPSRGSMSKMLEVCEAYASEHNLAFSTDVNPTKSKSKCIFMCGKTGNELPQKLPTKLLLNKEELPFVVNGTHLGHELHQSCQMSYDSRIKRAQFIDCSIEIRDIFAFALPEQVMKAVSLYALHCYGGMLWNFSDDNTGQFCRTFRTCAKLVYDVPRPTFTYIVENQLIKEYIPVRQELYSRYIKFHNGLKKSSSSEVRFLVNLIHFDVSSTTGKNLYVIQRETGCDPHEVMPQTIREVSLLAGIPDQDGIPYLEKLLKERTQMNYILEDTSDITKLINSLCTT